MFLPLSLVFMTLNVFCGQFEIPQQHIMASHDLGAIKLHYNNGGYKGFYVENGDRSQKIQNCWLDPQLRKVDTQKLNAFLDKGYFEVKRVDKEYALKAKVRGLGGGPWLAWLGYGAAKGALYGTIGAGVTALTATAVASAPVIGASAAASAATSSLVGTAVGATALGTATAAATPAAVAAAIGTSAAATAVATEVTLAATCSIGVAATVTTIEAISLTFGAILAAIPGPI